MLDQSPLLVHDWTKRQLGDDTPTWVRPITDAAGQRLGFVSFTGDPTSAWFSWLRKVRLDVYETEDAALLMTLTRLWGVLSSWDVEDADERHVGNLYAKSLVAPDNVAMGYLDRAANGDGRVLDPEGRTMSTFTRVQAAVVQVTLTSDLPANPFLRMLVLGCILTLEPAPKGVSKM